MARLWGWKLESFSKLAWTTVLVLVRLVHLPSDSITANAVWAAASEEAVIDHALEEYKKNNRQDDCKQEMRNSKRRWLSF